MEDEKLAAYYDDLTRRGGGAARFKQGLGFSGNDDVPSRGSALPTTSSFLSSFVRASSPSKTSEFEKQAQLQSIQNKLSQKPKEKTRSRSPSRERIRDKHLKRRRRGRSRSPSPSPSRDIDSRRRSRSRSRSRDRNRDKHSKRRSSRSHSPDRYSRRRSRSRSRDRRSRRSRSQEDGSRLKCRSRSRERSKRQESPAERRSEKGKKQSGGGGLDFAKLIDGYDNMTPAERVKAKMKLQLSRTAENDEAIGKGSGWERFDFDKDAPLDDDEEIEAAEDDAVLVKRMGQSFRFSAVEARKEEDMKAVHDEAMFGAPSYPPPTEADDEEEEEKKCHKKRNVPSVPMASLLSDQVLTMQKGSWRDRARKP